MAVYAIKPKTAFITKTKLKRTPKTEHSKNVAKFLDTHDIDIVIDEKNNKPICIIKDKR